VPCVCLPVLMLFAQAPAPAQMPALPMTQLDERALAADLDNHVLSLVVGQPTPIGDLLMMVVRGTSLSVVPDPGVSGTFIGELRDVTVRQALALVLSPLHLDYAIDGGVIHVFPQAPVTRIFDVNAIAADRVGTFTVGEPGATTITTTTPGDGFGDLRDGVRSLLTSNGTMSVDRKAGLIQVTDVPERVDRVAEYLDAVQARSHRQVQIDARVVEIELTDPAAQDLDWSRLARAGGSTGSSPGVRIRDVDRFLLALGEQGTVHVLASPRLLVMNNEPAVVSGTTASAGSTDGKSGITLSVVAQIAEDGMVTLSVGPIVRLAEPGDGTAPGATATRAADTLARVASGETMVVSGFGRDREMRQPSSSGPPEAVRRTRVALLVLLTPTVVNSAAE
jgi:MSHA biogenesis protein MshL